ncbi:MAG: response regulator [Desulfobacter sp.]|nr:MAG: response regulator [Desulfobacter sp.]
MKVLFVDDEKAFLDTLTKRLEKRGMEPAAVYGGSEALAFLAGHGKTDVVVLDVKMPGMDGIETLKAIRAEFPLVEVVMLTGHATVDSAIEGMKLGAFDYLMKPCNLDELVEKLEAAAVKKQAHEEKIMEARFREIAGQRV